MQTRDLLAVLVCGALAACASDEEEEHEFDSYDECVEHYESEGHTAAEIEDLCADFEGSDDS